MTLSLKQQKKMIPILFLLPALGFFLIFQIYPLLKGFQISFFDWKIMPGSKSTFIGFANYQHALHDPVFLRAFRNTLVYTFVTVPAQMFIAMIVAVLIDSVPIGKGFFRALYYIPVITSWVIVSLLIRYFFQSPAGVINYYLVDVFHLFPKPLPWLRDPSLAFIPILILGIWKGIGWCMVVFLAALIGVPAELKESAAIDGASAWKIFRHITLPLIRPTIVFTTVMLLIGGFNVFISVYLITGGGPNQMTEVMLSYSYHQAFDFLEFGYGAALSYLMAGLIIILSFLQIRFLRKPQEIG